MSSTFARARFTFLVASAGATFAALAGLAALAAPRRVEALDVPAIAPGSAYIQTNLASDVPGLASLVDPQLINPWGVAVRGISPFWTANNGTSTSSLLLVVPATDATTLNPSLPHVNIPGGLPTGVVGNATSDFQIGGPPAAASFLFASITGNITAWSSASGTTAQNAVSLPGHVWTGLALANNGVGNFLYAADFANGTIDVFNASFALQPGASFPFADPTIPTTAGNTYHPFNIQSIGGSLYVTYAKVGVDGRAENGVGNGFVRRFNANGVRDLTFGINNSALDAPWGIAIAPASFGIFGSALMVGNFSDQGRIHAFNPTTGAFLGTIQDPGGDPVAIDQLWALQVGNGGNGGDINALYFTAGIGREAHGLLGVLRPTTAQVTTLIRFSSDEYPVFEAQGSVEVTVIREGDTSGSATVNYSAVTSAGIGFADASDFTLAPNTLTFAPGEIARTFTLTATNDVTVEGDETLQLVLSNPTGAEVASSTATVTIIEPAAVPAIAPGSAYIQTNLASDITGLAQLLDPQLVNPWGIAVRGTSPFWTANNGTSTSSVLQVVPATDATTLNPSLPHVNIPGGLPTGVVGNATSDFQIGGPPAAASFLFASITGNITAWNSASGTTAQNAVSLPGHVWTGLTLANNGVGNFLYAADFANGTIDVFNASFALQPGASFPFADPTIPTTAGNTYHPFNIQSIGGSLYVTYAKVGIDGRAENGVGNGFVRRFNANGVRDLTFGINNSALDAPWGIAIAPASFGIFGSALMVGNFSDQGRIHAFNPTTGAFLGTIQDPGGDPVAIDQLWALQVGNGGNGGDINALYFTAGIGREAHGLFGVLRPTTAQATTLIRFLTDSVVAAETEGSIVVTVIREGDTTGSATVNYSAVTSAGTGFADAADFTLTPSTLTFAPGETFRTFSVGITNDALAEGNETLQLVLSNPTGALLGTSVETLTIIDNGTGVANLSITKTAPANVQPGATFDYTITVTNDGPDAATNVVVTDDLPPEVDFVSATPSQGSCVGTTTITCTLGTLNSGASATITITVNAPASTGSVSNTATVTSDQSDPDTTNNTSTAALQAGAAIPTLSETMLMLVALLLAAIGAMRLTGN